MKTDQETVYSYLKDIGLEPVPFQDPAAKWHLVVQYPRGNGDTHIDVVNPLGLRHALIVATKTVLAPEHMARFNELDFNAKQVFFFDFTNALNRDHVEYQLTHARDTGCPVEFQITSVRFEDGLTLDSFARTISTVFKAQIGAAACIHRHLTKPPAEASGFTSKK